MRRAYIILSCLVAIVLGVAVSGTALSQTAVPLLVNYQGELRSPMTGDPVPDGSYDMVFKVFDVQSGGTALWQGTHTTANGNPVQVTNGIFSVILGSGTGNPLDVSLFDGADRWLEIRVGIETLSPRQRIASVAYSMSSENSRLLAGREATEFANSTHSHSGSEITSGTVLEARIDPSIARDSEQAAAIAAHASINDAHHTRYTDGEAVAAMGTKSDANPLNHDKTTSLPWGSIISVPAGFADGLDDNSGGDITGVTAGAGLTGGGASGDVALSAAFAGTGAAPTVARSDHNHDSTYWTLTGNTGTSGTNFLGTTDSQLLDLRVNGVRALRLEPNATSANIIGGYSGNSVATGAVGATIGGGGKSSGIIGISYKNLVTDDFGTVGGGANNHAGDNAGTTSDRQFATVSGGYTNTASGSHATVGGGESNTASGWYGTVGGGFSNTANGLECTVGGGYSNTASGIDATVGGGYSNTASGSRATVGGGWSNGAGNVYATVGGGYSNNASANSATVSGGYNSSASANCATVGGGYGNNASSDSTTVGGGRNNNASGSYATVGGGYSNQATADYATIGGGGRSNPGDASTGNRVTDDYGTVGGGGCNQAGDNAGTTTDHTFATVAGGKQNTASGTNATVGGGYFNVASGASAAVPGGQQNTASGSGSFAAGLMARANHNGAFVWADISGYPFPSTANNEFSARCTGGARFVSAIDGSGNPSAGVRLAAGGGSWSSISDRALKENLVQMKGKEVLAKLMAVPITAWNYKAQEVSIRHMGPVAQDFYAAFGLGEDDKHITTIDADGVALAAIQGLHELLREKDAEIAAIKKQNSDLQQRLSALEKLFEKFSQDR